MAQDENCVTPASLAAPVNLYSLYEQGAKHPVELEITGRTASTISLYAVSNCLKDPTWKNIYI